MATNWAWATTSAFPSATARARPCSGRTSRTAASPRATSHACPLSPTARTGSSTSTPRSSFAAQLDGAHYPHAQGSARDRLGRLRGHSDARSGGAGDALRLAQQFGAVRAQPRRQAARAVGLEGGQAEQGELLVNLLS